MDIKKLSSDQKRLVEENIKLAYYFARKFSNTKYDDEDLYSIATIGLIKAAQSFNESKNIKFATYAGRCITNEILMYLRKEKKHIQDVSLEDVLNVDWDGNELTLSDIIPDPKSDFIEPMIVNTDFAETINVIFNALKKINRITVLCMLAEKKQQEIGELLGLSQSYISRICRKSILQIKKHLLSFAKEKMSFKEIFSIQLYIDRFYISFFNSDVPYFHRAYANLLNSNKISSFIKFLDNSNEKQTFFCMLNVPQSFISIAQIFIEMDRLSTSRTDSPEESLEIIKNYLLSLDFFTIKDLIARFPKEKTFLIRSAVHLAEIKGSITPLGTGKYIVNKTKPWYLQYLTVVESLLLTQKRWYNNHLFLLNYFLLVFIYKIKFIFKFFFKNFKYFI